MTTINPKGTSGVANLPAASSTGSGGAISGATIPEDGAAWGAEVAQDTQGDSSFNFDNYAQSTAAQMTALGYTSTNVDNYINAMYAGYLASGGVATEQAQGALGASSGSEAGIYGPMVSSGSLGLPGSGQEPPIGGQSGLALSASTATMLGNSLAQTSSPVNYPQWRASMEADLGTAGYAPSQVASFMGQVDAAYYQAKPNDLVNQGVAIGISMSSMLSSPTAMLNYTNNQLIPYLKSVGLNADQVNQVVDAVAAGYNAGSSNVVQAGLQQGEEVASLTAGAGSSFSFDAYAQSSLAQLNSAGTNLSPQQQAAYIDAMYAGYLRAGGVATQQATSASAMLIQTGSGVSTSITFTGASSNSGVSTSAAASTGSQVSSNTSSGTGSQVSSNTSSGTGSQVSSNTSSGTGSQVSSNTSANTSSAASTATAPSVGAPPRWVTITYSAVAASPSSAALSTDVANVMQAMTNLSSAAALAAASPTPQHLQNLQTQWQATRAAEVQFWSDVAAAGGSTAASAASLYSQYQSDPRFTLEGEMPASYSTGTVASFSSAALVDLTALAASSLLGPGVSLPSNIGNIVNSPTAFSSMSQNDFTGLTESMIALYQQNPAQYYSALNSIQDPTLRSALNYTVQNMVTNGADSLVQNGASLTQENNTLASYYSTLRSNPSTYIAWMPQTGTGASTGASTATGLGAVPSSTSDYTNVMAFLGSASSASFTSSAPSQYAEACTMMANLWKTNPSAYYQVLSGIQNPQLRNAVNAGVQIELTQNPQNITNSRGAGDFNQIWNQWYGKTGPGASSAAWTHLNLNVSGPTNGF